jgi:PQ loop repeat protein
MMLTATEIAGFAGAGLSGAAYVPQISHLVRAHCSAGISRPAFEVWLLASVLTTTRAIAIHAGVFIALGAIQIVATALIMLYAARYKDRPCPAHLPGQPTADEPATPAGHGRAPRALPARHPHSHAATEFQLTHLKGTT